MSRIYPDGTAPDSLRGFEFERVTDKRGKPEAAIPPKFTPDEYGASNAEFIPGGFDFDYKGGLRRDEIVSRSLDEANTIIEDAKTKAEQIIESAAAEGLEQGRAKGYQVGLEQAKPVIESFRGLLKELSETRAQFYAQAEKEMINLVTSVAHTIIGLEIERDPALVRNVIHKAVDHLRSREEMTIRVNPDDLAEAEKALPELTGEVEDIEKVSFKSDRQIKRGGCMVETNIGMIDARLETQLESIRKSFMTAMKDGDTTTSKPLKRDDNDDGQS